VENILSIDFESWVHFHRDAVREADFARGDGLARYDDGYTAMAARRVLQLLEQHGQKATFFVVAELADLFPEIFESIADAGHEIGYHTHSHRLLTSAEQLVGELEQSTRFLERFRPIGFRAPYIHLPEGSWEVLRNWGFRYSSSTYWSSGREAIDGFDEIPVSAVAFRGGRSNHALPDPLTLRMLTRRIPFGSGLFVAILGRSTSRLIERTNGSGQPAVLFIHPWQLYQARAIRGARFRLQVLRRNPLCLPYTRCVVKQCSALLERHTFTSFERFYFGPRIA
jgi:peptidoglycan/xylan/chitin deacetylase (PgdA/CDA1 family)